MVWGKAGQANELPAKSGSSNDLTVRISLLLIIGDVKEGEKNGGILDGSGSSKQVDCGLSSEQLKILQSANYSLQSAVRLEIVFALTILTLPNVFAKHIVSKDPRSFAFTLAAMGLLGVSFLWHRHQSFLRRTSESKSYLCCRPVAQQLSW